MRRFRLFLVITALLFVGYGVGLGAGAAAWAHHNFHNVTFQQEYTAVSADGVNDNWVELGCWEMTPVFYGQTRYIYNGYPRGEVDNVGATDRGATGSRHFGLGEMVGSYSHIHPLNAMDFDTGHATRQFQGHHGTNISTRRLGISGWGDFDSEYNVLKVVNNAVASNSYYKLPAIVRANC